MPKGIPKNGVNKGWFKKGKGFWTGKKRPDMEGNDWNRGRIPWNKGKHPKYMQGEDHPRWRGGKVKHSRGYILQRINGDYVLAHRLIVEEFIGRRLEPTEVIHHINGDKSDNNKNNLVIFADTGEHTKYHWRIGSFFYRKQKKL